MKKLLKRGRKPSEVSSQGLLNFANSISFNAQNYIPKDGLSFSLFKVEIFAGLTVALALVPEAIAFAFSCRSWSRISICYCGTNGNFTVNCRSI